MLHIFQMKPVVKNAKIYIKCRVTAFQCRLWWTSVFF